MKKQLSSLDLHFLVEELKILKDSRIDKIYQPEKNLIVFRLYKTNAGKKLLKINVGQSLFVSDEKDDYGEILGFGMLLRKHLDGCFLSDISQIKPERIVKISFIAKDSVKNLYIEFFGKGNAILCDVNGLIINSIEHHEFKDRAIKPKIAYKYPVMNYNFFDLSKNDLIDLFKTSKKDSLIISLATEVGLGGVYSEEVCILSGMDKIENPKNIDEKQCHSILDAIRSLIDKNIDAQVVMENSNLVDFVPFDLIFYKKYDKQKFPTFNESVSFFYSHLNLAEDTEFDKKLKSLQRIIEEQKYTIDELKKEETELREKGELIYHKYGLIKEIIEELNKASKKYGWKEIREKLKGHKVIKDINEKDRKVTVELN